MFKKIISSIMENKVFDSEKSRIKEILTIFLMPLSVVSIYFLMYVSNYFGILWHNGGGRSYYYLYMLLYVVIGVVIVMDLKITSNFVVGKFKYLFACERIILAFFMAVASDNFFSTMYLGKQIWVVVAGIQVASAINYILSKNRLDNSTIASRVS